MAIFFDIKAEDEAIVQNLLIRSGRSEELHKRANTDTFAHVHTHIHKHEIICMFSAFFTFICFCSPSFS